MSLIYFRMDIILQQFFSFTSFIEALKKIERYRNQFYWKDYPKLKRYESVADHSWRVSVLVLLVKDRLSQKMDLEKALKMAIIHDIAETVVGDSHPMGNDGTGKDTYYNNKDLAQKKYEKEKKGAEKLFSKLPEKEQNYCFNLWLEYEKRDCFESKVEKALDAIECALQVF